MKLFSLALAVCVANAVRTRKDQREGKGKGSKGGKGASASLLRAVETQEPDAVVFPRHAHPFFKKDHSVVEGPVQTNRWWANWLVDDGYLKDSSEFAVYPDPYSFKLLKDGNAVTGVSIAASGDRHVGTTRFKPWESYWEQYVVDSLNNDWIPDFVLSAAEGLIGRQKLVKEDIFGAHVQLTGAPGGTITFPIFPGMAYVSAKYEGGLTPTLTSEYGLRGVRKIRAGVWEVVNGYANKGYDGKEYRVYALTSAGALVGDDFDFNADGTMNKALDGWLRIAYVQDQGGLADLDKHATTGVVTGMNLDVVEGTITYTFNTESPADGSELLHFAYYHHESRITTSRRTKKLDTVKLKSRVRDDMYAIIGNIWEFPVDIAEAKGLNTLFNEKVDAATISKDLSAAWAELKYDWRLQLFREKDNYFSGKGYQKMGQVCHLLREYGDKAESDMCANILKDAFECLYNRQPGDDTLAGSPDRDWNPSLNNESCNWASTGYFYDTTFGGTPNRWMPHPVMCHHDADIFGGSCYNDHHYHSGYYVAAAGMLIDLKPEMKNNTKFTHFINVLVRDVNNPNKADTFFPLFRSYDWFSFHSWSRGLARDREGKDQESASEELNFHYGLVLYGRGIGNIEMENLAATQLTMSADVIKTYFFVENDNPLYPPEFKKFHVTGIYFQNTLILSTWFGYFKEFMHGIQMLPLTPALPMARTVEHSQQEFDDQLQNLTCFAAADPSVEKWKSVMLTANLATWNPTAAESMFTDDIQMDDGLTRVWAKYWIQVKKVQGAGSASNIDVCPDEKVINPDPTVRNPEWYITEAAGTKSTGKKSTEKTRTGKKSKGGKGEKGERKARV